jgi:hypothetical protein
MLCLSCRGSGEPSTTRQRQNTDLAAALQQLPLLRQLELSNSSFDNTGLAPISRLHHLQDLRIENLGRSRAAGYAALPTTLTWLDLRQMKELVITGSHADGIAKLTQLRHLQLQEIGGVELAVLGNMPQLTHLHLQGFEKSASSILVAQPMQQLLLALGGMRQLQHLHLAASLVGVQDATCWTALVVSTQLTYLNYDGPAWPYGACSCALWMSEQLTALQTMKTSKEQACILLRPRDCDCFHHCQQNAGIRCAQRI